MVTAGERRDSDVAADSRTVLPLTAAQRGMWFAETLSPDYSVNIAQYVDIRHEPGGLDYDLLEQCVYDVGKASEFGYVRLAEVDGVPVQYVDLDFEQRVDVIDFRREADPEAAAMAWMKAEYRRPVDLLTDQFIVISILKIADDRTFWYNRTHHIILDGYAALTIMRRTVDRYNAIRGGAEPRERPSADMAGIVEYEESYQRSSRRDTDREHWRQRVADLPERVTLAQSQTGAPLSFDNEVAGAELDPGFQADLEALASTLNSSIAVLLTAAFGAFLARMTATDDIVMSLPVTGRSTAKIKASGGMVSNVLPVRLRSVQSQPVRELIRDAQIELTGALRHQRYRSDDIRRDAGLDSSSVSFGPTINMVFFDDEVAIDGTTMEYRILTSGILEDLLINLYQASPGAPLVVDIHGNPHLYSAAEIALHHQRFLAFVRRFVHELDTPIRELPILLPGEAEELRRFERGPRLPVPTATAGTGALLDGFLDQAARTPDAPAIRDADGALSYEQFHARVRSLAAVLVADDVQPGDLVAVLLERGLDQVVAVYAILYAGAAYVPIDPDQPDSRRQLVLDTARPALVIDPGYLAASRHAAPMPGPVRPGSAAAAYVMFTSGSTGTPKGVRVSQRAVMNRLAWMHENYPLSPADVVLYKTPITFDVSVPELFGPLQVGATLVVADPGGHRDPDYLRSVIAETGTTSVHFVPSMLDVFVDSANPDEPLIPATVRRIYTSGEALPAGLAHRVVDSVDVEMINLYGPTEAAVEVTEYRVRKGDKLIPIGHPVANTETYVLDDRLRPVPVGVAGELYLAGIQLADGYVERPALSSERFVANPFAAGQRMYRTGDLVRWNAAGVVEYLGRTDFQVKIRGQRVELGEIETILGEAPGVAVAAVVVRADRGRTALIGYVKARSADSGELSPAACIQWCRQRLPGHMVPAAIVVVDDFELTSSGKLDRSALPDPVVGDTAEQPFVAAASAAEIALAAELAELLGIERVSMQDNMFALGADSLMAARLVARLRRNSGMALSLSSVFESATVGDLAAAVQLQGERPVLAPMPRPDRIPLSFPQTRLWFINRLDASAGTYNIPGAVRLSDVEPTALRAAIVDVVARHEPLRTTYPDIDGEPYQRVFGPERAEEIVDLPVITVAGTDVEATIAEIAARGFDLTSQTPLRTALLQSGPDGAQEIFVLVLHHIAGDGASLRPLIADLLMAYAARRAGAAPDWEPLPVQYADFTLWHRELLAAEADSVTLAERQLAYWRAELAGIPQILPLPTDRPRPAISSGAGDYVDDWFEAPLVEQIRHAAAEFGVTPFTIMHSALAVMLSRLTNESDIVVGTPIAGRDEPELADLIGMFVNTVALRVHVDDALPAADLVVAANRSRSRALSNGDVPFEQIVDAVAPQRSLAHSPIFQVSLTMQHDQTGGLEREDKSAIETIDARVAAAKYDIAVSIVEYPVSGAEDRMSVEFAYGADLFDRTTVERFAVYYRRAVESLIAALLSGAAVADVGLSNATELAAYEAALAAPHPPIVDPAWSLASCFSDAARLHADRAAVTAAGETLSYARLDAMASAVAAALAARDIGAGDLVGVATGRGVGLIASILGVLKSGAAYLPLDTTNPEDRLAYIVSDAAPALVIVDADTRALPLWDRVADTVAAQDIADLLAAGESAPAPRAVVGGDRRAYVIYTSGSTGRPKGVEVTHRDVLTLLAAADDEFDFRADDVWTMFHSYAFDFSVWELWGALAHGSRLVVVDRELARDPVRFTELLAVEGATVLSQTPSAFYQLAEVPCDPRLSLRYIVFGGERLSFEQVRRWFNERPDSAAQLVNMYGITETTVHVSFRALDPAEVSAGDPSLIGHPLSSLGIHILDSRMRPVPVGVVGEMYVTGSQLAQGYLRRPELSATRFVADPFGGGGARMYRTGDLARHVGDDIEYLGRSDGQVQLRGFRIEFGEVEAALLTADGVAGAAAAVVDVPARGEQLIGYVVVEPGASPDPQEVRAAAAHEVPGYMVPDQIVILERIPLTPNGKLDRAALPVPVAVQQTAEYVAPSSETERVVARVFAEVLGVDRVSAVESFFDLGGNSLTATKLAARVSAATGRSVSVMAVFQAPSIVELARHVAGSSEADGRPPLVPAMTDGTGPLSAVQAGMWLANRADPGSHAYNIAMALRLSGRMDLSAVRSAVAYVVERHQALRTMYPMVDGVPTQQVVATHDVLEQLDFTPVAVSGPVADSVRAVTHQGFDITVRPPLRLAVLRESESEHVLVLVVHHASADGASLAPLAHDLMAAYAAAVAESEPALPPLPVQYLDFAVRQREWLSTENADGRTIEAMQLAYWTERLDGAPDLISLPTDRPRPPVPSFDGGEVRFDLDATLVSELELVGKQQHASLFMVTQAAFAVLLSRLTGQHDVVVGTPFAGRGDPALDGLVGMFVNTLPLRADIRDNEAFGELLARVRDLDLADMSNADIAFDQVVGAVRRGPAASYSPVFQTMFAFQNFDFPRLEIAGLAIEPVSEELISAKVDMHLALHPNAPADAAAGIPAQLIYATDLFDHATVERFAARYVRVLEQIAADPAVLVGDIDISTQDEAAGATEPQAPAVESLVELIATAAQATPDTVAIDSGGAAVTFAALSELVTMMSAALPNPDAALVLAVTSAVPALAEGGPTALDKVLTDLRANASVAM